MKEQPSIAIIGAGPAGTVMAKVLQNHGISCQLYERELSHESRDQGGSLDMKLESGQRALKLAGVHEEFLKLARFNGQESRIMDPAGKLVFHEKSEEDDMTMPEIDRGELRSILLQGLKPGTVSWGSGIREITAVEAGKHQILFSDGSKKTFDLIVGADGAWSKVRTLLSPAKPEYSGVLFVQLGLRDIDRHAPELAEMIGHGHLFALGNNQGILAQRSSNAYVRVYFALRVPLEWGDKIKAIAGEPEKIKKLIREQYEGWAPKLLSILDKGDDEFLVRPIFALPIGHSWPHRPGLTLIGDSAHLMSPFSGMGANLALLDGAELAEAIATGEDFHESVCAFELKMQRRAEPEAQGAAEGIKGAISENSLADAIAQMQAHHAED